MKTCPVCETVTENLKDRFCEVCAWEFIITEDEFLQKLKIHKDLYQKTIDLKIDHDNTKIEDSINIVENKLTYDILQKDIFESNDDYADKILDLGEMIIGEIKLKLYNAEEEYFELELFIDDKLSKVNFQPHSTDDNWVLYIDKDEAKKLYKNSETYPLRITIEDVLFDDGTATIYSSSYFLNEYEIECL